MPNAAYAMAEELKNNLTLLLHQAMPGIAVEAFTGVIGAVVNDGWHFVMSPNAAQIFEPPIDE
ncbi:hypothetical protein C8J56DRAFT_1039130 [Mycena floridula]|nr:hypothetical protein C8J56DRAFT_1039130 [Mycena floridula]